jgi:hypothetical protein
MKLWFNGCNDSHDKSSEDSSGEVPMKSKERQLRAKRKRLLTKVCWVSSINLVLFQLSSARLSKSWANWKVSYKWLSLNDDAIFRCFVIERLASEPLIWLKYQSFWKLIIKLTQNWDLNSVNDLDIKEKIR